MMAASESQIDLIYNSYTTRTIAQLIEYTGLSESTVKRYVRKAKEERVIPDPERVKILTPLRTRESMAIGSKCEPLGGQNIIAEPVASLHIIGRDTTVEELVTLLSDTKKHLADAKALDNTNPQKGWLIVQHTKNALDAIKQLATWFGLNKGDLMQSETAVTSIKVDWQL